MPGAENAGLAFFGGDADCGIFRKIVEKSKEEDLQWDLFLAPHHCSWTFFNEQSYEDDPTPEETSIEFLEMHRQGAYIVASCKPVVKGGESPLSYQAAKGKKQVGKKNSGHDGSPERKRTSAHPLYNYPEWARRKRTVRRRTPLDHRQR